MEHALIYRLINYLASIVWVINGLFCKILNQVPRHQEIVETILPIDNGRLITFIIGISEVLMAVWILSKISPRLNAITQVSIVLVMNVIEQLVAGNLLLWGKFNFIFALGFCLLILYNEFVNKKKISKLHSLKQNNA